MRLFIAIKPPQEIISKIGETVTLLKNKFPNVQWENPEKVHLTLVFLGYMDKEKAAELRKTLQNFASTQIPLGLRGANLSYFYKKKADSIISLDVVDERDRLRQLYQNLKQHLRETGFSPAERFTPHLTIGRVKRTRFAHEVKKILVEILKTEIPKIGDFKVQTIQLYESLYSKQANTTQYRLIETFPLSA